MKPNPTQHRDQIMTAALLCASGRITVRDLEIVVDVVLHRVYTAAGCQEYQCGLRDALQGTR